MLASCVLEEIGAGKFFKLKTVFKYYKLSTASVVPLPPGYRLDIVIVPRTSLVSLAPTDSLMLGLQPLLDSHLILYLNTG